MRTTFLYLLIYLISKLWNYIIELTFSSNTKTSQFSVSQHSLKHSSLEPKSISFRYFAPMSLESCVLIILSVWISKLFMHVCRSMSPLLTIFRSKPFAIREFVTKSKMYSKIRARRNILAATCLFFVKRGNFGMFLMCCGGGRCYQLWRWSISVRLRWGNICAEENCDTK